MRRGGPRIRKILITLDGSSFAEAALRPAVELARRTGGELRLLTVHDPGWVFADREIDSVSRSRARRYLTRTLEALEVSDLTASLEVREGDVVDQILAEATEWGADLIAMAAHGRGPFSRFWLGSVARQCVRRSHRPVLLIRASDGSPRLSGSWEIGRVVVPLDGSPFAESALNPTLELAERLGVSLELLRVVTRLMVPASPFLPEAVAMGRQLLEEDRTAAGEYLDRITDWMRSWGLDPAKRVVADGEVAAAILEQAKSDPIVIATHARAGVNRVLLGSVAERVVQGAAGPVLVVPPDWQASLEEPASGGLAAGVRAAT